jgi:putative SOS response-associated peptidase YedK
MRIELPASPQELAPELSVAPCGRKAVTFFAGDDTRERKIVMMRWGLIPLSFWAKDPKIGISTVNAKAEKVAKAC